MVKEEIEDNRKRRKHFLFIILALLIAFIAYSVAQNALDTANINNVFEVVINNTNLAPDSTGVGGVPGTGERVSGTLYWANSSPLNVYIMGHKSIGGGAGLIDIDFSINGTVVQDDDAQVMAATPGNRSKWYQVPKGANYSASITGTGLAWYMWLEYPILSGKNGTLSINQTFTGLINNSYVPYDGATSNVNLGTHDLNGTNTNLTGYISVDTIIPHDGNGVKTQSFVSGSGFYTVLDSDGLSLYSKIGFLSLLRFNSATRFNLSQDLDMKGNNILNCGNCGDDDTNYVTISTYNSGLNQQANNNTAFSSNDTYQNNTLAALQTNDSYFNSSIFNQSENFRNDSINDTILRNYTAHIKIASFTRDLTTASGTQSIIGVGFKPSVVDFYSTKAGTKEFSIGQDDGTTAAAVLFEYNSASTMSFQTGNSIFYDLSDGVTMYVAHITSMDSDGFTLTWTKTGAPTGTLNIGYKAYR